MLWRDGPSYAPPGGIDRVRHPDAVVRDESALINFHGQWISAGAQQLQTATMLAFTVSHARMRSWHEIAVGCAREAAAGAGVGADRPITLCGTIGPAGYEPRDYWPLLESLLDLNVDAISMTTLYTRAHASAAITALDEVVRGAGGGAADMPLTASLTVSPSRGSERLDWLDKLTLPDGMTLGLNCCEGPANLRAVAEQLADRHGLLHLAPSAGLPDAQGKYPLGPEAWGEAIADLATNVPLVSIGACCGCTPAHLVAAREALEANV